VLFRTIKKISQMLAIKRICKNKFWFVDIPRTSSSSIKVELYNQFGCAYGKENVHDAELANEQVFADHLTASHFQSIMGEKNWKNIFSFTIVRNPFERALSIYSYRKKQQSIPSDWSFDDYVVELEKKFKGESSQYFVYPPHYIDQSSFICDGNNILIVDKVIRFENRMQGLTEVAKEINCSSLGFIHTQESNKNSDKYKSIYSASSKKIIENLYAKDLELLGYSYDN
jgi:hypothetical protein